MRKEVLTKIKCEEEGQRRGKLAAFQPQGFCDSVLQRAISVCVCACLCRDELAGGGDRRASSWIDRGSKSSSWEEPYCICVYIVL